MRSPFGKLLHRMKQKIPLCHLARQLARNRKGGICLRTPFKRTLAACCFAYITQAAVVCLPPLLFMPLYRLYDVSLSMLGTLIFVNFITQVLCDLLFARWLDRYGCRPFVLCGAFLVAVGFGCYALTPLVMPHHVFAGLFGSTVLFSGAGGLLEITLSPIVDRLTETSRGTVMSFLHSFYAWGQVLVVGVTAGLLALLGHPCWQWIVAGWTLLPLITWLLFAGVPLGAVPSVPSGYSLRQLLREPFFRAALGGIAFGSAAELCVEQWSSVFMEQSVGLSKLSSDLLGTACFAGMLGAGRLLYGMFGARFRLERILPFACLTAAGCCLALALCPLPWAAAMACGWMGLATSLIWPGTFVLAGARFPEAGARLFALLSCAGDFGGAVGPWLIGMLADRMAGSSTAGFRISMRIGSVFALIACLCFLRMRHSEKKRLDFRDFQV